MKREMLPIFTSWFTENMSLGQAWGSTRAQQAYLFFFLLGKEGKCLYHTRIHIEILASQFAECSPVGSHLLLTLVAEMETEQVVDTEIAPILVTQLPCSQVLGP